MLKRHGGSAVRVFTIWQPMLATDWSAPASPVLQRMSDTRVQQYWDPSHLVAKRMQEDARAPQPEQECCVRSGILWDLAAVYPTGLSWNDRLPAAAIFNGPVVDRAPQIASFLSSTARHVPPFSLAAVRCSPMAAVRALAIHGRGPARTGMPADTSISAGCLSVS